MQAWPIRDYSKGTYPMAYEYARDGSGAYYRRAPLGNGTYRYEGSTEGKSWHSIAGDKWAAPVEQGHGLVWVQDLDWRETMEGTDDG